MSTDTVKDSDCLHCVLQEPLSAFLRAHPEQAVGVTAQGLLQLACELVVANCSEEDRPLTSGALVVALIKHWAASCQWIDGRKNQH